MNEKIIFKHNTALQVETYSVLMLRVDYIKKYISMRGPVSSVGIATGYGLDGPGI
jgi:hypothetical protein